MKKLCLMVLTLIMSLSLCFGLTACSSNIVENLQNEIGAVLEGGKFKEGSILNVNEVKISSEQADDIFETLEDIGLNISDKTKAYIYDIFVSKDDKEVQPDGKVKVSIPMEIDEGATGYIVYHIDDDGKTTRVPATYEDGKVIFETDGFSVYVFVMDNCVYGEAVGKVNFTLKVTVDPAKSGYIEINGEKKDASNGISVNAGKNYELKAVANEGYQFVGWYDADFNEMLAEDDVYSIFMNHNHNLIAKFKEAPYSLEINNGGNGLVEYDRNYISKNSSYSVERNAQVTLTAMANSRYKFDGWYNKANSSLLSNSETYTFTMDSNKSIEARFEYTGLVDVSFQVEPFECGYLEYNNTKYYGISDSWLEGTKYEVKAVPNFGYKFLYWEVEGEQIYNEVCSGTVETDILEYKAVFAEAYYCLEAIAVGGGKIEIYHYGSYEETQLVTEYRKSFDYIGNVVTLAACEGEGYKFVGWFNEENEMLTDNISYEVTVNGKIKLEARFEKSTYNLKVTTSEGGYITENGETVDLSNGREVKNNAQITLTAVANKDYDFVGWFDADTQNLIMEDETLEFKVRGNRNIVAKFKETPYSLEIYNGGNGFVEYDGNFISKKSSYSIERNAKVTLTALANSRYKFDGWYNKANSSLLSKSETYTFTMDSNMSIEARFEYTGLVEVLFQVDPYIGGYLVYNNTKYYGISDYWLEGTEYEIKAVPEFGYKFLYWEVEGEKIYNEVYSGTIGTIGFEYKAVFAEVNYCLEATVVGGGKIEASSDYVVGELVTEYSKIFDKAGNKVTLVAYEDKGYKFIGWFNEKNEKLTDETNYEVLVNEKIKLEARFEKAKYNFKATTTDGGYITENGKKVDLSNGREVEYSTQITLTAVANKNYAFVGWFKGQDCLSETAMYTFNVADNMEVEARFVKCFTLTFNIEPVGKGYITKNGQNVDYSSGIECRYGDKIELIAEAVDGYQFVGWFDVDTKELIMEDDNLYLTVDGNCNIVAKFEVTPPENYRFLCDIYGNGSIWENNENVNEKYMYGTTLVEGTNITLTAKADTHWKFKGWYKSSGDTLISTDETYTFVLTYHTSVYAMFEEKPMNNFLAEGDPTYGGYFTENGEIVDFENGRLVESNTKITLTAVANEGYTFKYWYCYTADQKEVTITTNATYTFTVNEPTTVYAKFEEKLMYNFLAQCVENEGGYITENNETVDFGNGRSVEPNTKITLTAVANDGYKFKGWGTRDDNWNLTIISTDATHTFTVSESIVDENGRYYVQAIFEEKPTGLRLDAHNAGFSYNDNNELITTIYQIGNEIKPNIEYVGVYATYSSLDKQDEYLTLDEDYTRNLGDLDFTKAGIYTVTYTYKADTTLTATLTVQVVEKPADGSMTETEWNAIIEYYNKQTNIKVMGRYSNDDDNPQTGAQIMIYQYDGTAYSEDGYFENELSSQLYKGKIFYLVKDGDTYSRIEWQDMGGDDNWTLVTSDYGAEDSYNWAIENEIYGLLDDYDFSEFNFNATDKTYIKTETDKSIIITFTFENDVITKIEIKEVETGREITTTITFGDAVVDVPTAETVE